MEPRRPSTRIILISALLLFSHRAFAQFLQQGPKLVGTGFIANAQQGSAVAFSADGNTVIVGGSDDRVHGFDNGIGAAWIWIRSDAFWVQQGPKLRAVDAVGDARQGTSVAISADGNTAIIGGPGDDIATGAAWIWTRNAGVWTQQGPKLVVPGSSLQGTSVSLSADGNTAIVGAPGDHFGVGAAFVWTRSGGVWSQQGPKLWSIGGARQGQSVGLSADGNTAIIGGPYSNDIGAAWIWTRNQGIWSQQTKLAAPPFGFSQRQGNAVALSADGNTAIVGAPDDSDGNGAAWIWARNDGVWTQQGKLAGSETVGAREGAAVSLSADGNTALVGGPDHAGGAGAVWVWTRTQGFWSRQGVKLTGTAIVDLDTYDGLGGSVALSADGNTAIAGRSGDDGFTGAVWVWTRNGGAWTEQPPKLVGSGAEGTIYQGSGVAVSADGNTAIVGAYADHYRSGGAWIWTRNGGFWTQESVKLVGSGAEGRAGQGSFVAISADGKTALSGGPDDAGVAGAVWVWTRENGIWKQQGPKLVGSGAVGRPFQGLSGALSADGNTAIIGGFNDNDSLGAVWVWTRNGAAWTQQGPKLVGSGALKSFTGRVLQGSSVALSADGNTAIVGGPVDNDGRGAAWVWTRSEGVWTQQGPKLLASDTEGFANQGTAVSLSADGNTALVGGIRDHDGSGAVWVWTRNAGVWTQQGPKLVGSGAAGAAGQGSSTSLSADGNTALIGGPFDNNSAGAVWFWIRRGGTWTQLGTKLAGADTAGVAALGLSVSLSADGLTAIAGGPYDNRSLGAAWVFAVPQRQRAVRH